MAKQSADVLAAVFESEKHRLARHGWDQVSSESSGVGEEGRGKAWKVCSHGRPVARRGEEGRASEMQDGCMVLV